MQKNSYAFLFALLLFLGAFVTGPPENINSIQNVFIECTSLETIIIPESVTDISGAFRYCSSLTSIIIPSNVTNIDQAFTGCVKLTTVIIPHGVDSIGVSTFYNCTSLVSVVIPDSVTAIDAQAFYNCNSLESIYYLGTSTDWNSITISSNSNNSLFNATRYYYSETAVYDGNHWHYADGVPMVWANE